MGKFKRLPNHFGNISRLPGKRRNPYRVRICTGKTLDVENERVIRNYDVIGYYATYEDALMHLTEYHRNPYNLDASTITFGEVFEKWSDEVYPMMSQSNINSYNAAFKVCGSIKDRPFIEIRYQELQHVIDTSGKNYPTLRKVLLLFYALYKWSAKNQISDNNQAQFVDIRQYKDKNPNKIDRNPFTKDEIDTLWKWSEGNDSVKVILIMIYSGVRQGELRDLKKDEVFISDHYFYISKSKTPSGVRKVPISDKIMPFFVYFMQKSLSKWFISTSDGKHFEDHNFRDAYFVQVLDQIGLDSNHRPHDTRHTCVSLLTSAGVDDRLIRKIVGHSGKGVTENVYTHIDMQNLLDAINKI